MAREQGLNIVGFCHMYLHVALKVLLRALGSNGYRSYRDASSTRPGTRPRAFSS